MAPYSKTYIWWVAEKGAIASVGYTSQYIRYMTFTLEELQMQHALLVSR